MSSKVYLHKCSHDIIYFQIWVATLLLHVTPYTACFSDEVFFRRRALHVHGVWHFQTHWDSPCCKCLSHVPIWWTKWNKPGTTFISYVWIQYEYCTALDSTHTLSSIWNCSSPQTSVPSRIGVHIYKHVIYICIHMYVCMYVCMYVM